MRRLLLAVVVMMHVYILSSQETTGSLAGRVLEMDGGPIPIATLVLSNTETNEQFVSYSQENGSYRFLNVTPAMYVLDVSYLGYNDYSDPAITIRLGVETKQNIILTQSGLEIDEVTILGQKANTNTEQYITQRQIQQTPTFFRSIQELQRSNPENNLNSFQGASHRFNNLNIDGVATNDIIGFQEPASGAAGSQANGTPGSLSKTQPIGFGAIKELSTKTTPFDVSVGNFNGANIDIITKNGTNQFGGSVFGYLNNRFTAGRKLDGESVDVAEYSDYQLGLNIGGPIIENKLFFFANAEFANSTTPLINGPGTDGSNIAIEDVTAIRSKLIEEFDYDPGAFETASNTIQSTKAFVRLDYLISEKHKLTLRNNFVTSFADNLEWSQTFFNFGNQGFTHNSTANSTVLELKSNYNNVFNKLNISFNRVVEGRDFDGRIFPHIQIASSAASRIFAGTYREASVFNTNFNTYQITDKLSIVKNNHSLSAGFLAQYHDLDYGFLSAWNGRWEYSSVDNFLNDQPSRVRGVYNVNLENNSFDFVQNNPAASLGILEGALYAQDKWSISPRLSLMYGARLDAQFLTKDLPVSSLISNSEDFSQYNNQYTNNYQINPRAQLSYDWAEGKYSVNIGTGLFSGRLPYLWFAYIDYISGTDYFNVDIRPDSPLPLTENLSDLTELQPSITEVNLLDPDFKYPRDWKSNIDFNWKVNSEWTAGASLSYTKVIQGLLFQSINRNPVFTNLTGADDRVIYDTSEGSKISQDFTNVFLLTNTTEGYRTNATLRAERNTNKSNLILGYSYGLSKDASSTVRSSPAANYEWNQALLGNNPELSFSNYDLRHKFNASYATYISIGDNQLAVSLLYNGRSGSPYSIVYQGDLNSDGSSRNDLVYVPNSSSDITLVDIVDGNTTITAEEQYASLDAYISNNDYLDSKRGTYAERNGAKTPWNHSLDGSLNYEFNYLRGRKSRVRMDIFNILNLVNSSWGKQYFVPNVVNSSFSLLSFEGLTADNIPTYSFDIPADQTPWLVDSINSRWRIQVGLEFDF